VSTWDIAPEQARAVIRATGVTAGAYAKARTNCAKNLDDAHSVAGPILARALGDFSTNHNTRISSVINQTTRLLQAAGSVVDNYVQGDEAMAAAAQRSVERSREYAQHPAMYDRFGESAAMTGGLPR